jgi:hypothetical protein
LLIAGDLVPNMKMWNERKYGLPVPSAIHTSLVEYYDSLRRIIDFPERFCRP